MVALETELLGTPNGFSVVDAHSVGLFEAIKAFSGIIITAWYFGLVSSIEPHSLFKRVSFQDVHPYRSFP